MKTKHAALALWLVLLCTCAQAQIGITTNTLSPALGAYDQYYLPGPVDEATQAMTIEASGVNTSSGDNDILTYVAGDKASKGQSFTTGPNPAGYTISSITIRHILWTNFLANGSFMSIPAGATFPFRFGTISGANITSMLDTNATYSGAALASAGTGGTGIYFTFDLSSAGLPTLAPNTTYFFELASTVNPPYFELHNTRTNATSYTGGTAFYGDTTASLDVSGVVNLPPYGGEFAFVAKLAAVGAPTVTATVNPSSASSGQKFTITATVTPGVGTVTNVSVDLSAIGGSAAANLVLSGGNVYTNTFTVSASAPFGGAYLNVNAKDNTPLVGSYGVPFTVLPSTRTWSGGSALDNNWSDSANWQGSLAPSLTGNSVVFAGTTRLTPNMDNNYSVSGLVFSNTAGAFTISSSVDDTLTNGNGGIVNNSASTQTLNVPVVLSAAQSFSLAGGNLTLNSNVVGGADVTLTGSGTLNLASPGTSAIGNVRLSSGQLNISAGTVNVAETSGTLTRIESNATLTVSSGSLNISGAGGWFPIGVSTGATGAVVVAGGTISVSNNYGTQVGNESGAGILTINSGTFINNDTLPVGFLVGENGSMGGTVNLNGGVLAVNQVIAHGAGGNFYFNGGTLKPLYSNAGFWANASTLSTSIRNGGAVVDTSGFNITIAEPLLHSTVAGDNAVDGGLTKIGNGTLILSGGFLYTGPNKVLGGTLSMSTASGIPASGGDLVVSNAALVLDASGGAPMPAGNVSLDSGAAVTITNAPSANAINGTGNVVVQTNTTLSLNYGSLAGNPTTAAINVTGSASVTGTNNVINITGNGFVAGQFPLIKYGSGSLASISGLKLGSLPAGVNATLVNNTGNQSVDLNINFVGQTLTWYGATNGVVLAKWDINTDTNWNSGGAKYLEYNGNTFGDLVTFDDTLFNDGVQTPATNVILTTALHPSQITMNNSSYPYEFSGAGSLAGPGALTLNGGNSVTLTTSNTYTGGTFINAGTLVVTNDNELGTNTAAVTLNGGTLQAAGSIASARTVAVTSPSSLDVVPGATAQLSGAINGTGDLALTDNGTVTISSTAPSTFGNLRVSGGQLNITAGTVNVTDSQGSSTRVENNAVIVVSGGTLNIVGSNVLNGWFPIGVTGGATGAVVVAGGTINVNDHWGTEIGNESGAGILTINSGTYINNDAGGVGLLISDGSSTGGTLNLNGGSLIVNQLGAGAGAGGQFYWNGGTLKPLLSNAGFWNNSTKIAASVRNGGAVVDTSGFNITIGQPLLHSTVAGDNAIDGGLTKIGNGTLTLSGVNTFTGPTTINAGALAGTGTIAGVLTNNATLAPGSGMTISGNITLNAGSTNQFAVNGTTLAKSSITAGGSVTYGGQLSIVPSGTFTSGQQFQLFSGAGATSASSFASIAGSPGAGLAFSFTNGVLSVVGSSGPSGPAHLTNSYIAGALSLAWPSGQGWRLQTETNLESNNWVYVTDGSVSSTNITVDTTKPTVFYRLAYP